MSAHQGHRPVPPTHSNLTTRHRRQQHIPSTQPYSHSTPQPASEGEWLEAVDGQDDESVVEVGEAGGGGEEDEGGEKEGREQGEGGEWHDSVRERVGSIGRRFLRDARTDYHRVIRGASGAGVVL